MRVVHVLRKPLSEPNVAANILKHGTGAINVDAGRIDSGGTHGSAESAGQGKGYKDTQKYGIYSKGIGGVVEPPHPGGRWPANLILQHLPGCREVGIKQVKSITGGFTPGSTGAFGKHGLYGTALGSEDKVKHGDAKGMETVTAWDCEPGCPVLDLDEQSEASRFFKQITTPPHATGAR